MTDADGFKPKYRAHGFAGDDYVVGPQPPMMSQEADDVISIVDEVGLYRLAGSDGCACGRFIVRGLEVEIGCGKGDRRGVWVSSRHMDWSDDDASRARVGQAVAQIVKDTDERGPIPVYLSSWADHRAGLDAISGKGG